MDTKLAFSYSSLHHYPRSNYQQGQRIHLPYTERLLSYHTDLQPQTVNSIQDKQMPLGKMEKEGRATTDKHNVFHTFVLLASKCPLYWSVSNLYG